MTAAVRYWKMNGLGNDFVVLDGRGRDLVLREDQVRWLADREVGIGCDQLILLEDVTEGEADVAMGIFNRDGGEIGACGNATRCVAALMAQETGRSDIVVETASGMRQACVEDGQVTVNMGRPGLKWSDIPLAEEFEDTRGIELQIGPIDAPVLHTPSVVSMGNPHAIFFVDADPVTFDLAAFGPMLENHPLFPERANISLAQVTGREQAIVRVWERGAGLTQACGTAACAVAVAGVRKGLLNRKSHIVLPGGMLHIHWRSSDDCVLMRGPWMLDGEGETSLVAPEGVS